MTHNIRLRAIIIGDCLPAKSRLRNDKHALSGLFQGCVLVEQERIVWTPTDTKPLTIIQYWIMNVSWRHCTLPEALRPVHTSNNVEATFDFVATNGNNVERNFVLSTKSKQIEHVQFVLSNFQFDIVERTTFRSTLLPKPATLLPKTATMSKQHSTLSKESSTCSVRQCCVDIVASMDGTFKCKRPHAFLIGMCNV